MDSEYKGFAKLRLVHFEWGSFIVPDLIIINNYYFRPFTLDNCLLHEISDNHIIASIICNLSCDVSIRIEIESSALIEMLPDYSQVFAIKIFGPKRKLLYLAVLGDACIQNTGITIRLFHHTNLDAKNNIRASRRLWSSRWNLQGSAEVEERSFVYLTPLPRINNTGDMIKIGMHPNEIIRFQLDQNRDNKLEHIVEVPVLKRNISRLSEALKIWIDWRFITPTHFFLHSGRLQPNGLANWHEAVMPWIFRIPMEISAILDIGTHNNPITSIPKFVPLTYFIEGIAFEKEGLLAPLKENRAESKYIWKTDIRPPKGNILLAWFEQGNSRVFDTL